MHSTLLRTAAFLLLMSTSVSAARGIVTVHRKPAVAKHHFFDPANRPPEMPNLSPGEAAVCQGSYGVSVQMVYAPNVRRQNNGKYLAKLVVDRVEVELTMTNDIWLPKNAGEQLKQHEEAHRRISEMIYDKIAETAARRAAEKLDGQQFSGEGDTRKAAQEAADAALSAAHSAMLQAYLDQTSRADKKVQELFDRITAHGTRLKIKEADAIEQAFALKPPPLWVAATQPATKPGTRPTR